MPTENRILDFGDFRIDAEERALYRGSSPVSLAPKVFDTLFALASRAGRVVSKDTLMEEIWQDTFVEDNNLTQHIFTLRRVLGESKDGTKFIETVPRRGYRFVPEVRTVQKTEAASNDAAGNSSDSNPRQNSFIPTTGPNVPESPLSSGRRFLLIGVAVIALLGSLGFALRSSWLAAESKGISLVRLTESGNLSGAAISPDGKFFAYVAQDGKTNSLRLKNIQTESEVVVVPSTEARLGNPRFSPDGNFIYMMSGNELIKMPVLGGEPTRIATNLWSNFSVSPDGKHVAFPRNTTPAKSSSLILANTDGSGERIVATRVNPNFYVAWGPAPVFSPDGASLTAVTSRYGSSEAGIVEIDTLSGEEREVTMDTDWAAIEYIDWRSASELLVAGKKKGDDTTQIWSAKFPAGSVERLTNDFNNYLSFTLSADKNEILAVQETENLHLWLFDSETGATRQVTAGVSRSDGRFGLALAPDGHIIFTARDKNNYDIYSVNPEGNDVLRLTKNAGRNLDPVVSPDGRTLAFASDRTGRSRLWMMGRDGSEARQITAVSDDKDTVEKSPYFSGDGRYIYYVSERSGQGSIRKIPVDGGESLSVSRTDKVVDKPVPSPDDKFLAHQVYNEETDSPWQVAVQSLEDAGTSERFFSFPAFRLRVRWMLDSNSVISVDDRTGGYNLWLTDLATGERRPITTFDTQKIYRFDVSPDRRSYVLARGDYFYDAVLIQR